MGQFLERHKLPEPIQKEKDNMNSPIFTKDIKYVLKKTLQNQQQKNSRSRKFHYQHLKKK